MLEIKTAAKARQHMTDQPRIAALYRYPVKGLSPEPLERVSLQAGGTFPGDRAFAIENGPSGFDPAIWEEQIATYSNLKQFSAGAPKLSDVITGSILKATENKRPRIG